MPADASPFAANGTHLQRYASVFNAVEINSSFYRPHRASTYARWGESVPDDFRFAVKVPKSVTHGMRLVGCADLLDEFLAPVRALNGKLGCLLVQLPPKLELDTDAADRFLRELRDRHEGAVALEARNASWFGPHADDLLAAHVRLRVRAAFPRPHRARACARRARRQRCLVHLRQYRGARRGSRCAPPPGETRRAAPGS